MRIICILVFLCLSSSVRSQNDTTVFDKQTEIATSEYVFKVPAGWKNVQQIDLTSKDRKFEITGVGLPTECNHAPVTGTLTLRKYECAKLSTGEDYIISEITSYPDRVTEAGCNYQTDSLKIKSGEKATLISTRFLRRTKLSNYSRFDLIACLYVYYYLSIPRTYLCL